MSRVPVYGALALAVFALVIPICASHAHALGLSPASIVIPYNETTRGTAVPFTVRPLATGGETGLVRIRAEGDLADAISFSSTTVPFDTPVSATVLLPQDLTPGDHMQDIIVTLVPEGGAGTVNANIEIAMTLIVQVPYPDQYLTGTITPNKAEGTAMLVTLMLQNRGTVPVTPDDLVVNVLDGDRTKDIIRYEPPTILPTSFAGVSARYDGVGAGTILPGVYMLEARSHYAAKELVVRRETDIGTPRIRIAYARYAAEETGSIRPIDIRGETVWNRPINGTLMVYLDNGTIPVYEQALPIVPTFSQRVYLDTAVTGMPVERLRVALRAPGSEANLDIPIVKQSAGTRSPGLNATLLVLMTIAIIVGAALFVLWKMRKDA